MFRADTSGVFDLNASVILFFANTIGATSFNIPALLCRLITGLAAFANPACND